MMKYLNEKNSLNELRFFLALSVVVIHLAYLTKSPLAHLILDAIYPLAKMAVDIFFIISGFLIYKSWDASKSFKKYFFSRFFRIYPLYVFVILLTPIICIILFDTYIDCSDLSHYWLVNSFFLNFLNPSLDGLFPTNYHNIINGALWSLKVEVMFYLILPLVYFLIEKSKEPVKLLIFMFVLSLLSNFLVYGVELIFEISLGQLYYQLPTKFYLFLIGISIFKYFNFYKSIIGRFEIVTIILLSCLFYFLGFNNLLSYLVAFMVIVIAFQNGRLQFFSKNSDFSYSLYITHFPIIQILVAFGFLFDDWLDFFTYLLIQSLVCLFSWNIIERKFLSLNKIILKRS